MSEGVIEPSAVYQPSQGQTFYRTYNTRTLPPPSNGGQAFPGAGPRFDYSGSRIYRAFSATPGGRVRVTVPSGVPKFLGNRPVILFSWVLAMMMVSLDEWHTHHVLPRPARLWYTSLTYLLLAMLATFDAAVPLATLLAIGLTISVAYNYYTGSGGFGNYGAAEASAPGFNAAKAAGQ